MRQNKLVTIVGNVGSGKSTLVERLAEVLPATTIPADELYKTNPFFLLALKDRQRWSLTADLWFMYERVALSRQIPEKLAGGHVVVDSGLIMSWVYAHSRLGSEYMNKPEWQLYQALYKELTDGLVESDVVVYLKLPTQVLLERIRERGREFEIVHHNQVYLESLERSLGSAVQELKGRGVRVVEVDEADINLGELVKKLLVN